MFQCRTCHTIIDSKSVNQHYVCICGSNGWRKVGAQAADYVRSEMKRLEGVAESNHVPEMAHD